MPAAPSIQPASS